MTRRRVLAAILVSLTLAGTSVHAGPDDSTPAPTPAHEVTASEDDVLVLEVTVERYRASQGVLAYQVGEHVFLPLRELTDVLGLAIQVDVPSKSASGWVIDRDREFGLDLRAATIRFDDHVEGIPDASVHAGFDDIYVRSDVLARWLPVNFDVNTARMRVDVEAREPIPLFARLDRDRRRSRIGKNAILRPHYPERHSDYRMVSWPLIDTSIQSSGTEDRTSTRFDALGRGDLFGLRATGMAQISRGDDRPSSGWWNMSRQALGGNLLGPLKATHFEFGDVTTSSAPLISRGQRGRGFMVTNRDVQRRRFDVTEVEGSEQPGWEAELYVNGQLSDFQTVADDGTYRFVDVPIRVGMNNIRVVTYGPQGEQREYTHHFNGSSGLGLRGRLQYEISSIQPGRTVFGTAPANYLATRNPSWAHRINATYGVTNSLVANAGYNRVPALGREIDVLSLGIDQSIGRSLWQYDQVVALGGGTTFRLSSATELAGQQARAEVMRSDQLAAETGNASVGEQWQASTRVSGRFRQDTENPIGYSVDVHHRSFDRRVLQGETGLQIQGTTSLSGVQSINKIALRRISPDASGVTAHDVLGSHLVAGYVGATRLRGALHHAYESRFSFTSAEVQGFRRIGKSLNAGLQYLHFFEEGTPHRLRASVGLSSDHMTSSLYVNLDSDGGMLWGLRLSSSLTLQPATGGFEMSGRPVTQAGAALARAFIDRNADGRFDANDEPLPGVSFRRNLKWRDRATNDRGEAFLTGIPSNRRVNVEIDMSSVFDPFLVPRYEGLTAIVHEGGMSELDFPFTYVGDIEGRVFRNILRTQSMSTVGLELIDPDGERVASTVTEFDGYYLFQRVPPGPYKIRVVETTLPHRDFIVPPAARVVVPDRGDFVSGPEIVLVREGERLDVQFAEDGSVRDVDPAALLGEDASETAVAGLRSLVARFEERRPLEELLEDPTLSDAEQRTLRILYDLFFGDEGRQWIAR